MASRRDDQVKDVAVYIKNPRSGALLDAGTGKTSNVRMDTYWLWYQKKVRTFWVMPKSLLQKNLEEQLRFSDFEPGDIVIYDDPDRQLTEPQAAALKAPSKAKPRVLAKLEEAGLIKKGKITEVGARILKKRHAGLTRSQAAGIQKPRKASVAVKQFLREKGYLRKNIDRSTPEGKLALYEWQGKYNIFMTSGCDAKVWLMGFARFRQDWAKLKAFHGNSRVLTVDEIHMGFSTANFG